MSHHSVIFSISSSSKPYHPFLPIYLGERHIQEYFDKKRGRKQKFIKLQEEKSRHDERRKQMRVKVQAKLVVGFGELILMESGVDDSV